MREFKKTPRLPRWKRWWQAILRLFSAGSKYSNFGGHNDRMKERRRKTKFDK